MFIQLAGKTGRFAYILAGLQYANSLTKQGNFAAPELRFPPSRLPGKKTNDNNSAIR